MKRRGLFIVFVIYLLLQSTARASGSSSLPEIKITDCKILNLFFELWVDSYFGKASLSFERAAWIQYNEQSGYEFLWWQKSSDLTRVSWNEYIPSITWKKGIPLDVIALAHTHPENVDPKPSPNDSSVAKKLGIPIYTISKSGIWKVTPDGTIIQEADRHWQDRRHGRLSCTTGPEH